MRALAHAFLVAVACAAAGAALAHHSVANFDFTKSATVTGTVQYFSFTSPHSFIDLQVREADGQEHTYKIFTVARVVMSRTGWAADDLKAGDRVTVTGSPDRKDPRYMYLNQVTFPSGKIWSHDPALQR